MKLHHIGYAVRNIDDSRKSFELLGFYPVGSEHRDYLRNVDILFMKNMADTVELIAIADRNTRSDIDFLTKSGRNQFVGPYHVCFEVRDLESAVRELREKRFVISSEVAPAPAICGRRVVFLYHKNTGLIELLEGEVTDDGGRGL
jgi:methylmalonyl-CoA/ethylmalonyl-CoA epimerase